MQSQKANVFSLAQESYNRSFAFRHTSEHSGRDFVAKPSVLTKSRFFAISPSSDVKSEQKESIQQKKYFFFI